MKQYILLISSLLFFNSCIVLHSGQVSSGPLLDTNASYVDIARGEARSVFVLGFGKLDRESLVLESKKKMYLSRPVQKGEYYSNFTTGVTNKLILLGLIHVTKISVSADVLKTINGQQTFSDKFMSEITPFIPAKTIRADSLQKTELTKTDINGSTIMVGDSVYYMSDSKTYSLYKIASVEKKTVLLTAVSKDAKNTLVPIEGMFFIKNTALDNFKSGEKVTAEVLNPYNSTVYEEGEVMGAGNKTLLVKTGSGFYALPSSRLKKK